jgi:hypothetical protein
MTSNQNRLKANKHCLYNKINCMEKYSYYPFSSEYQLFSEIQFRLLSTTLLIFSLDLYKNMNRQCGPR